MRTSAVAKREGACGEKACKCTRKALARLSEIGGCALLDSAANAHIIEGAQRINQLTGGFSGGP